ncbi:MAG TPA: EAL domain-containing protein, partial [Acidimicrobiales bacterium]
DVTTGSTGVTVASIDTGVDYRHPDLYKNIWINQAEIPSAIRSALTDVDADGLITFWNPSAEAMFGYREGEVVGAPVTVIIPEELRPGHVAGMARLAAGGPPRLLGRPVEVTAQRRSGARFPIEISLARGTARGEAFYTAVIRDITERKEFETRLERRANVDELTDLASQSRFLEEVERALELAGTAMVLRIDVDGFKVVNDSLGHEAGDFVLVQLARRLRSELAPGDVAARLGGDEFGVVRACDRIEEALDLAGRIARAVRAPMVVGRRELSLTVSTGVAAATTGQQALDTVRQADTAMHRAKSRGRGRIEVFDDRMHQRAVERLDTEEGLRRALEQGHLILHYQPEIDLASGAVVAAEALVRWEHPQRGLLMPGHFIAVAEETGLIEALSDWVLTAALRQLARWRSELPVAASFGMAVNLSGEQLGDDRIVGVVSEALAASGCPGEAVVLEVTETAVMREPETAARVLAGLAELGVRLAIDDFGTGYSSLAYLQRFPLHLLKVDRSFVQGLDTDDGRAIVRAVVNLAAGLGMATLAEGVETEEQLAVLRDLGCDMAQGYLMARPLQAKAMADLLVTRPTW